MNWHKTNLALILILVIMDIFLAKMLYETYKEAKLLPDDMITEAQHNLSLSGVTVSEDTIDKNIYSGTVYLYRTGIFFAEEMSNNAESTHPAVMKLLSVLSTQSGNKSESVQFFDIPNGTSVSALDKDGNAISSAQITGTTGFEFSMSKLHTDEISALAEKHLASGLYEYQPQSCPRVINNLFNEIYSRDVGIKKLYSVQCGPGNLYLCCNTVNGKLIYDMPICFYIENGKILYINGNIFFNTPDKSYNSALLDGINILYSIPKNSERGNITVENEKMGYHIINAGKNESYVVPSWIVKCSGKEQFTLVFNALTGDLLK